MSPSSSTIQRKTLLLFSFCPHRGSQQLLSVDTLCNAFPRLVLGCLRKHLSSPPSQEQVTTPLRHFSDCKPLRACSGNTAQPSWNNRAQPCQEGSASILSRTLKPTPGTARVAHTCSVKSQLAPCFRESSAGISPAQMLQMLLKNLFPSEPRSRPQGRRWHQGEAIPAAPLGRALSEGGTRSLCRSWQLLLGRTARPQPALPGSSPVPELAALEAAPALSRRDTQLLSRSRSHPAGPPILPFPAPQGRHPCPCVQLAPSQHRLPDRGSAARYRCAERGRPEQGWECRSCRLPAPPLHGKERNISHLVMTAVLSQPHLKAGTR